MGCIYPQARVKIPTVAGDYMEMLLDWKPDIVHSQCEFSTFFLAKKIASELHIPIVHTYHTVYEDYTHYFSPQKAWGRNIVQLMTRKLANAVETLIAPSDKIRKILEGYQVSCPVEVIPSGISLEKYQACKEEDWQEKIRAQLGIPQDALVLVYVGRMAKEKNIEELLEYQQEAEKYGVILLLVGDGPHLPELKKKAEELKVTEHVIFTGMIAPEEVGHYYQAGDLFVSASISETQGMTYAEALPLYGLRQNVFTDPQKPMKVEPGIYPLNGADENSLVVTTVDFALTYFVVSGELERIFLEESGNGKE